jgi:hypothetical protein
MINPQSGTGSPGILLKPPVFFPTIPKMEQCSVRNRFRNGPTENLFKYEQPHLRISVN